MRVTKSRLHGHVGCAGLRWQSGLGYQFEAPLLYPMVWDRVGRVATERLVRPFGVGS